MTQGTYVWQEYLSYPERALAGQYVFNIFDPDKIYPYWARILGACMSEWNYDTRVLLTFYDPEQVSPFFLSALAANYGLELDAADPLNVQRAKTKNAVPTFKLKGLDISVRNRIRALGYTGYATEIWVNPTLGSNYQSAVLNAFGTPSSSATGANDPSTCIERPHGYETGDGTEDGFYLSSRLAIHLNDGSGNPLDLTLAIKTAVANDLLNDVLPAHVSIRWFDTDFTCATEGVVVTDNLTITHV
jgi:hypothetical protein